MHDLLKTLGWCEDHLGDKLTAKLPWEDADLDSFGFIQKYEVSMENYPSLLNS